MEMAAMLLGLQHRQAQAGTAARLLEAVMLENPPWSSC